MTYNICHGVDFSNASAPDWKMDWWDIRLDKTADVIKGVNADMVCLNEVYDSGAGALDKQAKKLATSAEYLDCAFGKAIEFPENRTYGNAFLSRFNIVEKQVYSVKSPVGDERRSGENEYYEDRAILRTVVDVSGEFIAVYSVHFGLNLLEQERMVAQLISLIDQEKYPHILMGDFNVEPSASVLQPLFSRMTSAAKYCDNRQKTFSTYNDQMQIDYIFVSNRFKVLSFERIEANCSDHYPCVALLEF